MRTCGWCVRNGMLCTSTCSARRCALSVEGGKATLHAVHTTIRSTECGKDVGRTVFILGVQTASSTREAAGGRSCARRLTRR